MKLKVTSLGLLRGFAVLIVCFCHFGKPVSQGTVATELFSILGHYGQYGVHIFFVISGFIIPFSLFKAEYKLRDYFLFLYKRFLRLHPPYLVALLLTLLISAASYHARHLPNPETPSTIFQSLFYLHAPSDNPVFWTLKVEAQYYLFMGLFFVLMNKWPTFSLVIAIPVLVVAGPELLGEYIHFFTFICFFMIGTVVYLIYIKQQFAKIEYLVLIGLITFVFVHDELPAAIAAVATLAFILLYRKPVPSLLDFAGEISYSIYLIHFPLGTKFINYLQRHVGANQYWILFILAMCVCIVSAYVFWKLFEKPSAQISSNVRYGKSRVAVRNLNSD